MIITAGTAKGRRVHCPEGLDVRPTSSKIRQAFFNILRNKVPDCRFLDLFAGSGLMGLEALSRGAQELVAVEETKRMVGIIRENLDHLNFEAHIVQGDVRRVLNHLPKHHFDIIFADPPYKSPFAESALHAVSKHELLAKDGVLAIEHAREMKLPETSGSLELKETRDWGQTAISFYAHTQ